MAIDVTDDPLRLALARLSSAAHERPLITRFAPSPTGYLHLGHVASAIFVWGVARAVGAEVILRIEDHDRGRSRAEYEAAIIEDLAWLGFRPDRGVESVGRPSPHRQSDHEATYVAALSRLERAGMVYACDCSRKEIDAAMGARDPGEELRYSGRCRTRGLEQTAAGGVAIRVTLPEEVVAFTDLWLGEQRQTPHRQCGDLLARERGGSWTYQFAVTVDDLDERVNLVIRGQDLVASTGRQVLLARALGRPTPPLFFHHPLICDDTGQKLGKRRFSEAIAKRRQAGETPEEIIGLAAHLVGLTPKQTRLGAAELEELFRGPR